MKVPAIFLPFPVGSGAQKAAEIEPKVGESLTSPLAETGQGGEKAPNQGETLTNSGYEEEADTINEELWLDALGPCGK